MKPKIVYLDIENTPSLGYFFDKWKEGNIVDEVAGWYILSYAYKINDGPVKVCALPDYPGYKKNMENDKALMQELWDLLNEADIVVAHNGDRFDIRKINARFIYHGMTPPRPYKTIDTLKVARRYFSFNSNRLNDLGQYLGVGKKLAHTGFALWKGCMSGEMESWNLMKKYNKQDVVLLEEVYMKLRPFMTNHPNLNIYDENQDSCPSCRSEVQRRGFGYTQLGSYQRYKCKNPTCGAWSRGSNIRADLVVR